MCKKQGNAGYYYNASNGNTYIFNASYAMFDEAQTTCKARGGHLVAWTSYKEQAEVEGYFSSNGYLMPTYHQIYWMGLRVNGSRPKFGWLDPTVDPPSYRTYSHWGTNATTNMHLNVNRQGRP